MGRPCRVALGGYIYHVLKGANGRLPIFQTDGDYAAFERVLGEALEHVPGMRLFAYCLLPNHWHLLLWPRHDAVYCFTGGRRRVSYFVRRSFAREPMQQRMKPLLLIATLLLLGVGMAVWLIWWPPWTSALEKRLLGSWEGSGKVLGELSIAPGKGVPGGTFSVSTTCTVQAEFKPDGTYTWKEQHQGDGISMNFWVPKEDASPARWEVVGAQGNKLTVRLHSGEVVFDFQGANAFAMNLPESAKASGTIAFRRSRKPKE
jgi:REP element-mobilizing transposase RayT